MEGDATTIGDVAGTGAELETQTVDEAVLYGVGNSFDDFDVYIYIYDQKKAIFSEQSVS